MKNLILILISLLFINSYGQSLNFEEYAKRTELKGGKLAFFAYNVDRDEVLAKYKEQEYMAPASILKLLTTSAAVQVLGANYQFKTQIAYKGVIEEGVLKGDLIVIGGGDPSLGFNLVSHEPEFPKVFFEGVTLALKEKNIKKIEGNIIADLSFFEKNPLPSGWTWGDIGNYYGAGSHALNIHGNRFMAFFKSGKQEGSKSILTEVFPKLDYQIDNEVKTANISNDQAYFYSSPWSDHIFMEGRIPLGKSRFKVKGSIPDPPKFLLETLGNQMKSNQIEWNGVFQYASRKVKVNEVIFTHKSTELKNIAAYTNSKSDNFFAETLLKLLGTQLGQGSTENGIKVLRSFLNDKGLKSTEYRATDGSGLSRDNLITCKLMCDFLCMNLEDADTKFTELGLSIAGKTGSFRRLGAGTCYEGALRGKSGYMRNVRSYTGIVQNDAGENIVFCTILNDHNCSPTKARLILSELLEEVLCD
ncbi:MAG: D-alanyl-D-alanine carboxypeptidase/D-alanyl-D-alanine-endopeptidase [Bacteroidota bacterium]